MGHVQRLKVPAIQPKVEADVGYHLLGYGRAQNPHSAPEKDLQAFAGLNTGSGMGEADAPSSRSEKIQVRNDRKREHARLER